MSQPPPGGLGGAPPPGGPVGYYTPPAGMGARPPVILWFRVYAIASALLYGSVAFFWESLSPSRDPALQIWIQGVLSLSMVLFLIYGIGALVPYKPWGWTYGLVMIALGMLGCLAPFSVILVIFWSRPQVKAAFCRL